jgi:hypothetical protein
MPRCEDFPCCGHESGDCPDSQGRMTCVECGKKLAKNVSSSICVACLQRMSRCYQYDEYGDFDYSMDY